MTHEIVVSIPVTVALDAERRPVGMSVGQPHAFSPDGVDDPAEQDRLRSAALAAIGAASITFDIGEDPVDVPAVEEIAPAPEPQADISGQETEAGQPEIEPEPVREDVTVVEAPAMVVDRDEGPNPPRPRPPRG